MKTHGTLNKQELPEAGSIGVAQVVNPSKDVKRTKVRSDRDAYHPERATQKKTRRFHFALVFAAMLFIVAGVGVASAYDSFEGGSIAVDDLTSKVITLNVNSQPQEVATNCETVGELLNERHIFLTEDDFLDMGLNQQLYDGMTVWVRKAIDVTVNAGSQTITVHSQPLTVAQALEAAGVEVDDDDVMELPLLSYIYNDSTITVNKMETKLEEVLEDIQPKVVTQEVSDLPVGTTAVLNEGTPGQKRTVFSVTYKDGVEVSRELVSSEVVKEPVDKVEGVGSATATVSSLAYAPTVEDGDFSGSRVLTCQATAYTWTGNRTATGTWPAEGRTIAVDPSVIPLGTRVYVEGYGYAVAEDTGGAIQGNIIDLYMDSYTDCINWGRRTVTVYILD